MATNCATKTRRRVHHTCCGRSIDAWLRTEHDRLHKQTTTCFASNNTYSAPSSWMPRLRLRPRPWGLLPYHRTKPSYPAATCASPAVRSKSDQSVMAAFGSEDQLSREAARAPAPWDNKGDSNPQLQSISGFLPHLIYYRILTYVPSSTVPAFIADVERKELSGLNQRHSLVHWGALTALKATSTRGVWCTRKPAAGTPTFSGGQQNE